MRKAVPVIQVILVILVVTHGGCNKMQEGNIKKENVMYKKLTTNMMVEDVSRTVDFYSDALGFEFVMGVPENSQEIVTTRQKGQALGFAIMKCGNIEMMFQAKQALAEEIPELSGMDIGGSLTFYIEVQDVRGLYAKLKDKVTIIKDMQTTFYGKQEFYIRDCNGYILTFAGEIREQSL
ncbi:MAG: VOC family protein [Phycisphaerae bacterium]|nr:VOC family protein [Phycisphaerae bacterium]